MSGLAKPCFLKSSVFLVIRLFARLARSPSQASNGCPAVPGSTMLIKQAFEEKLLELEQLTAPLYEQMAETELYINAKLDAVLLQVAESVVKSAKAFPAKAKKAQSAVKKRKSSGQIRVSTSQRTTRTSTRASRLTRRSKESQKVVVKTEPLSPESSSSDLDAEQENVAPCVQPSDTMERAVVDATLHAHTPPAAPRPSRSQFTPLQTRSQARLVQSAEESAQLTAPKSVAKLPKALRALQLASPAKTSPVTRMRQLFSPYAKCSVEEKARAFEQKLAGPVPLVMTPSKGTPFKATQSKATPKATVVPSQVVTTATCGAPKRLSSPTGRRVTRSALQREEIEDVADSSSSTLTSGDEDGCAWLEPPVVKQAALPKSKAPSSEAKGTAASLLSATKRSKFPSTAHRTASATPTKVTSFLKQNVSVAPLARPSPSEPRAGPSSRTSPELARKRVCSQSPEPRRKKLLSSSSDSENQRKKDLLRKKAEAMKKERERKLAKVHAARQVREAKKKEADLIREQREQEREAERLKNRHAFLQRTQTERSSGVVSTLKRKAESPAFPQAPKFLSPVTQAPKFLSPVPKNPRIHGKQDAEAAMLVFGQPSTSLSQKAKLNNSLQQQALLNSLSMSLKSQASIKVPEIPDVSTTAQEGGKLGAAADSTFTMGNTTFTVDASCPETPVHKGEPRQSSYDITPHRCELPPEPNKDKENYDIEDLDSGDETDDDDQPRKEVPGWATPLSMAKLIERQHSIHPNGDALFGTIAILKLDSVFRINKPYFNKRTSSGVWTPQKT